MPRGKIFEGAPRNAALWHPWIDGGPVMSSGVWYGVNTRTLDPFYFDPWIGKQEDCYDSTVFGVIGQKGSGKTTLLKVTPERVGSLQVRDRRGGPVVEARTRIHDRKREEIEGEAGEDWEEGATGLLEGEYGPLTRHLGSEVIALSNYRINPFDPDMGMRERDILEIAVNLIEMAKGGPLVDHQSLVLQVSVHQLMKAPRRLVSPEMLEYLVRRLNLDDVLAYFAHKDKPILKELEADPRLRKQLNLHLDKPVNISEADIRRDASRTSTNLLRLMGGDFGDLFGSENLGTKTQLSRATLSQAMVTLDWTGVNDKARSAMASILMKQMSVAVDIGDISQIPHIDIGDEEREAFKSLMYVRFLHELVQKSRAFHTALFRSALSLVDLTTAGPVGSEIRELSKGIVRGLGGLFVARQKNSPEVLEELERWGFSDLDLYQTTKLERGCFAFKPQRGDTTFFQLVLTPTEEGLVQTDAAADRMTDRRPIMYDVDRIIAEFQQRDDDFKHGRVKWEPGQEEEIQ